MVWLGPTRLDENTTAVYLVVYWGVFLVAVAIAMGCVVLDLRYIRYQYALGERDIFQETLGSESFRRAIAEAQRAEAEEKAQQGGTPKPPGGPSPT